MTESIELSLHRLAAPASPAPSRPIRVLVVEDDPASADLVWIYLTRGEPGAFAVERVATLLEAMARVSEPGIDVVLLDLGLPELSGYRSFLAMSRAGNRNVPIVVFTGDESEASQAATADLGAAGYLVKDRTSPELLRRALRDAAQKALRKD
jgi:DNA-binding response OmpR family regulator